MRDTIKQPRRKAKNDTRRVVLLSCEGVKTERIYFISIRNELHRSINIEILPHNGTDPLSIVRCVAIVKEQRIRENSWQGGDAAWAIFDGDEHYQNNRANWIDAIQLAKLNDIKLGITNPCFEFWYLLHFRDWFKYLNRIQAKQYLKEYIPDYVKNQNIYPTYLSDKTNNAINRAEKIIHFTKNIISEDENPLNPLVNPYITVHSLVSDLLDLKTIE